MTDVRQTFTGKKTHLVSLALIVHGFGTLLNLVPDSSFTSGGEVGAVAEILAGALLSFLRMSITKLHNELGEMRTMLREMHTLLQDRGQGGPG